MRTGQRARRLRVAEAVWQVDKTLAVNRRGKIGDENRGAGRFAETMFGRNFLDGSGADEERIAFIRDRCFRGLRTLLVAGQPPQ
jgi:hypothetical protein